LVAGADALELKGVTVRSEPDPAGMPFSRACVHIDAATPASMPTPFRRPPVRLAADLGDGASASRQ
jgi:hypothetical protein